MPNLIFESQIEQTLLQRPQQVCGFDVLKSTLIQTPSSPMSNKTFAAREVRLAATPEYTAESVAVTFLVDINARMLAQGINNVELTQRMGTTRSYITRLFRGSTNLSVQSMTRLADAVGCSVRVQVQDSPDTRPLA